MSDDVMPDDVTSSLRASYDRHADERERNEPEPWKQAVRQAFLDLLRAEGRHSLLEIGAGPGKDSLFFQQHGLDVTSLDLSPAMVELCRQKGLRALAGDIREQGFEPAELDAVYSMNCLLHIPKRELPAVLGEIRRVLRPGGLFFLGLWGGPDREGIWADDKYEPKRFFSFHTDDGIRAAVRPFFDEVSFAALPVNPSPDQHFQHLVLRRPANT
jgi:SAM-dependent methyltransferase